MRWNSENVGLVGEFPDKILDISGFCCILGFSVRSVQISFSIRSVGVPSVFSFDLVPNWHSKPCSRLCIDQFLPKSALSSPEPTSKKANEVYNRPRTL